MVPRGFVLRKYTGVLVFPQKDPCQPDKCPNLPFPRPYAGQFLRLPRGAGPSTIRAVKRQETWVSTS